ncbi:hypothetical protein BCR35DRAFT_312038 [Leucosporidium creatinivorum]|uniref:MYND-type domain-containing protein n=1 Tax=Leucosporidium creatinivorum TaxID=106004 RepID=A0A1Y2G314_9BASI|nr:hypothetical protein BCR35DRAFT_312038 [Leucosporidium creatinivorum]
MDGFKDKECVVCGAATTKTCSACKKLFFCSAEHQKLLWPIHKHLCGKDQYSPPPLTEGEVEWACAHPDCFGTNPSFPDVTTALNALRGSTSKSNYGLALSGPPLLQALIRQHCFSTNYPGYHPTEHELFRLSFGLAAHVEYKLYSGGGGAFPSSALPHFYRIFEMMAYLSHLETKAKWASLMGNAELGKALEFVQFARTGAGNVERFLSSLQTEMGETALSVMELVAEMKNRYEELLGPRRPKSAFEFVLLFGSNLFTCEHSNELGFLTLPFARLSAHRTSLMELNACIARRPPKKTYKGGI